MAGKMIKFEYDGQDCEGDYAETLEVSTHFVVCPRCQGKGSTTNPAIDGNGLNDESLGDPDFMEYYLGGVYDIACPECNSERVIAVANEDDPNYEKWLEMETAAQEMRQEIAHEQRMGY
jgi:hypothetical protein